MSSRHCLGYSGSDLQPRLKKKDWECRPLGPSVNGRLDGLNGVTTCRTLQLLTPTSNISTVMKSFIKHNGQIQGFFSIREYQLLGPLGIITNGSTCHNNSASVFTLGMGNLNLATESIHIK